MSKWQLPTIKGTEVNPQATRAPPIVRVHGVEAEVGQLLLNHFAGRIGQFHMAQAQKYALGTAVIQKGMLDHPDVKMRYTNQYGTEIITVDVHPQVIEELVKKPPVFWDFALIEIVVAEAEYVALQGWAYLTTPLEAEILPASELPFAGVAVDIDQWPVVDRMINSPNPDDVVFERTGEGEWVASFLVDLRPARGMSAVIVDLHATASPSLEVLPTYAPVWGIAAGPGDGSGSHPWPPADINAGNTGNAPPGYTDEQWYSTMPAGNFNYATLEWEFVGVDVVVAGDGSFWTVFPSPFTEPPGDNVEISWGVKTDSSSYSPGYSGDVPVPSEVQVTLFKSDPGMEVATVTGELSPDYVRWDFPSSPLRPGAVVLGRPHIPDADVSLSLYDRFNVPRLGTVIIDQINWSLGFRDDS